MFLNGSMRERNPFQCAFPDDSRGASLRKDETMRKFGLAVALAASVAVAGCTTYPDQYGYDAYGNPVYYNNGYNNGYYGNGYGYNNGYYGNKGYGSNGSEVSARVAILAPCGLARSP